MHGLRCTAQRCETASWVAKVITSKALEHMRQNPRSRGLRCRAWLCDVANSATKVITSKTLDA
eukprot:15447605-Alexandrium_andersonii.AAC.1